jgi:hypothetical protein
MAKVMMSKKRPTMEVSQYQTSNYTTEPVTEKKTQK